ncbi:unnamed protein product [Anisakis simplex]|uniref:Ion_trans domain-containing protein n=1 Tax=Anisakis simplex TaxID=6269 RepID=A0A0M3IZM8_ANISI|nr:unnamed protein product [Anisakis simplex]
MQMPADPSIREEQRLIIHSSKSELPPTPPPVDEKSNPSSQPLPTGADILDIQSLKEVPTRMISNRVSEDDTLNNVILQKLGCFPTCFQFTLLRLCALFLLIAAWLTMIFFPCVHLEYTEINPNNLSVANRIREMINETCPADPLWWIEETIFINAIISKSSYYKTLNETHERPEQQFYNSERSASDDFMEEAMLDIVEIALFLVFAVVEIRKQIFDLCTDAKVVPYGMITAGIVFVILAIIFSIDFIILLKQSERLEAEKFVMMAISLHREMNLEGMDTSIQRELENNKRSPEESNPMRTQRDETGREQDGRGWYMLSVSFGK